ncbi:MAG: tRNA lysidine(34) synthetase TilS [Verrucomicrobia bacterium]|nr:MAG: tRNA lysidine(34) synthetase TilS [Verrucomicrobiota bacterium]
MGIRIYKMNAVRSAEKLALALPQSALHPAVLSWLATSAPLSQRVGIALSGGADSVALLLLLWGHFPERRKQWLALHFDHRLRGRASSDDARFCAALCRALGVELVTGRWVDAPSTASEGRARAARSDFMDTTLAGRGIEGLCTGHQRDDVAESLFMRLARGAGAAGLCAPRPVHVLPGRGRVHLRPLLSLDKAQLISALGAAGAKWREDTSNTSQVHLRNRVRAQLVPAWREAVEPGRDALAGLALSRELLEEDDAALEAWAQRVTRIDARGALALTPLRTVPRAVLRRVVHRWLATTPVRTDLNRAGFNALLDLAAPTGRVGAKHSLGSGHFAVRFRTRLVCVPVAVTDRDGPTA